MGTGQTLCQGRTPRTIEGHSRCTPVLCRAVAGSRLRRPLWVLRRATRKGWSDAWQAIAADAIPPRLDSLNRFPRMMQEYFVREVRESQRRSLERQTSLQTKAQAEAYLSDVRARIQECFGPWPERTPLNPRITGVVERDAYRIEKVIFESRPEFFVTANLYVPRQGKFPAPAIVGSCGHSDNGKANESYQSFCQGLARQGYVVLIFDPIGQGERLQLPDENLKSRLRPGVSEHLMVGNQQFLVGEFLGSWRAWDGIRALDYLLSREEVDPRHVGITGNSGGGTMTTWLCGVDPRWTMAAPSCFVTTFGRNLENELPADTEQCPPRAISLGLDHTDFLAALGPKPIILLAQERDYFDVRGTLEAYARLETLILVAGRLSGRRGDPNRSRRSWFLEGRPRSHVWMVQPCDAHRRFVGRACSQARRRPEDTVVYPVRGKSPNCRAAPCLPSPAPPPTNFRKNAECLAARHCGRRLKTILKLSPRNVSRRFPYHASPRGV